jgi:hypothetical protein
MSAAAIRPPSFWISSSEHGDEARAFAEEISRANKLPLTTRYEP